MKYRALKGRWKGHTSYKGGGVFMSAPTSRRKRMYRFAGLNNRMAKNRKKYKR